MRKKEKLRTKEKFRKSIYLQKNYFKFGLRGLEISLSILIFFMMFLLFFLIMQNKSFLEIAKISIGMPKGQDYLVIFAGCILFIIVPYLIGVRTGMNLKKNQN